jgi:hypothetical protein
MTTPGGEKLTEGGGSNPVSAMVDALRERLRSPFFSAVVISWILINWRAILFLCFDGRPILNRIEYIETKYFTFWHSAGLPVIAAFVYVAISPWAVLLLGWYRGKSEIRINIRKMAELKRLANEQREIDDPGGVARQLKQLNEDVARQKEFLTNALKSEAEAKDRADALAREAESKAAANLSEQNRSVAARNQLTKDIEEMTKKKEQLHADVMAIQEAKQKLRMERTEYLLKPLTEANQDALRDFAKALQRHGMAAGSAERFMREQGAPTGLLMEVRRDMNRVRAAADKKAAPPVLTYKVEAKGAVTEEALKRVRNIAGVARVEVQSDHNGLVVTIIGEDGTDGKIEASIESALQLHGDQFRRLHAGA